MLRKVGLTRPFENIKWLFNLTRPPSGVHNNLGNAYESKGWTDKAIQHYEESLRLSRITSTPTTILESSLGEKGLMDRAIKHFEIALALNPKDPDIHLTSPMPIG